MRYRKNPVLAWLICLFLLFAQQGAPLHALSHAVEDIAEANAAQASHDKQYPWSHEACEQCLAYAAIGAGLQPASSQLSLSAPPAVFVARVQTAFHPRSIARYRSRAPPFPA